VSDDERDDTAGQLDGPPEVPNERLRPALELAFAVAVAGQRLKPPIAPPVALKRFLNFQKLPSSALGTVRKVVESDAVFRDRVAKVATEELATELGVVWLQRAGDWERRAARLLADVDAEEQRDGEQRDDRSAQRRLVLTESALTRARGELAATLADGERDRQRRLDAEAAASRAVEDRDRALGGVEALTAEVRRLTERTATAQTRIDQLVGERDAARAEVADIRQRLDDALARSVASEQRLADAEQRAATTAALTAAATPPVAAQAVAPGALDAASRALGDTAGALRELAAALDRTSQVVRPALPSDVADDQRSVLPASPPPAAPASGRVASRPAAPPRAAAPTPRGSRQRKPLATPGGIVDDSELVTDHLLRTDGVTVLVDGYNVAKLGWPGFALADQRDRLLDALEDLVRRIGCRVVVVFDGADVPGVSSGRRLVRVRFSTPGISADQEIIALVVDSPADQAIVVATNDREIISRVRAAGANVLSSDQLLAAVKR
jgi:predicted RNA-binding protein with PIN domain